MKLAYFDMFKDCLHLFSCELYIDEGHVKHIKFYLFYFFNSKSNRKVL